MGFSRFCPLALFLGQSGVCLRRLALRLFSISCLQRLVTGSGDQTAKVWDSASGKELLTLKGHGGVVWSVAFSPDGQRIVTGSEDQTAKVWDSASPNQVTAWQAEEHAAEQRLAQLRAAEASEKPEIKQP